MTPINGTAPQISVSPILINIFIGAATLVFVAVAAVLIYIIIDSLK